MSVSVTFHGHATLSIDVNGTTLLVDPFFSGNPQAKIVADDINPDYILLSHGHGDHVADDERVLPNVQERPALPMPRLPIGLGDMASKR